jgi:vancomycin resistance protein VanW
MHERVEKPTKRSKLRLYWGNKYYRLRRYLYWFTGGLRFAKVENKILPIECMTHATPLLRKLKDVDMVLQHNKITNLKIAVPKLNHVTLMPGETFSYWKLIGKPTKRKGYLAGMQLRAGQVCAATGGGLCQLSNLIFWMTLHTPLTITERHRHSYDVFPDANRKVPFGSGATCFYNYGDLMIRNDTDSIFQLELTVTDTMLCGIWRTDTAPAVHYEVYEKEHHIQAEYWGGYTRHNRLFRKCSNLGGDLLSDELVVENHAFMMYEPLLQQK